MNWTLILLLTGIMLFSYWLNYIMGGPLSDDPKRVDVKAILFCIPNWLAIRRLNQIGKLRDFRKALTEELLMTSDHVVRNGLIIDMRLKRFLTGRELFTWERSLLCPICLHWWLTVIVGIFLLQSNGFNARHDFYIAAFTYLVNHLIIRKIS